MYKQVSAPGKSVQKKSVQTAPESRIMALLALSFIIPHTYDPMQALKLQAPDSDGMPMVIFSSRGKLNEMIIFLGSRKPKLITRITRNLSHLLRYWHHCYQESDQALPIDLITPSSSFLI